jgi:hypothetical protein
VPKVILSDDGNHEPCIDNEHDFRGQYTDDGSFGNDLVYRIEYRENKNALWKAIVGGKQTNPIDITKTITIPTKGYYRFIVGREDIIDGENCIAASNEIFLDAQDCSSPEVNIVDIIGDTVVCFDKTLTLNGTFSHIRNPFGNNIAYRWEFRHIDSTNWKVLKEQNATPPLNVSWQITDINRADEGYYRLRVGKRENIETPNRYALSDSIYLIALGTEQVPDIRIQLSATPNRVVNLAKFIDSVRFTNIHWDKANTHAPAILDGTVETTGSVNSWNFTNKGVYTYKYTVTSQCGSSEAKVYIRMLENKIFRTPDTITICENHMASQSLHLNSILGMELGGVWKYDNTVNPDATTVVANVTKMPPSSRHAGSLIFNASKAWSVAPSSYSISYKNYNNAKMFKFKYTPPTGSTFTEDMELVIIVTE